MGEILESPGSEVEVTRTCYAKRGALCRKKGDRNGSTREEERKAKEKVVGQCVMLSERRDYHCRKLKTELHGGVYHRTLTAKSGTTTKVEKKNSIDRN